MKEKRNVLTSKIFISHFKSNTLVLVGKFSILFLIVFLTFLFFIKPFNDLQKQVAYIRESNYFAVVEQYQSSTEYELNKIDLLFVAKNSFEDTSTIIVYTSDDSLHEENVYNENFLVDGQNQLLKQNEIAISEKLAYELRLGIGDSIYISDNFSNNLHAFVISFIYRYQTDFYGVASYSNISNVIVSSSSDLASKNDVIYVQFLSEEEYYEGTIDLVSAKDLYIMSEDLNELNKKILLYDSIGIALLLIVFTFMFFVSRTDLKKDYQIYTYIGYGKKHLRIIKFIDILALYLIPSIIISLILFIIEHFNGYFKYISTSIIIFAIAFVALLSIGGQIREKNNIRIQKFHS